jgi:hypothetical protein
VIAVESFHLSKVLQGLLLITHAIIAKSEHVFAVNQVLGIKRVLPNEQVRQ